MSILNKVTLKTLGKNKTRTLVTIIGIILSAAMIMAVTTIVSSLQNFLVEMAIFQTGDWYGEVYNLKSADIDKIENDSKVDNLAYMQRIGYSPLENSKNESKPYLYIAGMSSNFSDTLPITLSSGRLPEAESEIILPGHLKTDGTAEYSIGDEITLDIGDRSSNGLTLTQKDYYLKSEIGEKTEDFTVTGHHTYTVVGFYERCMSIEEYYAPGYVALSVADETANDSYDVFIKTVSAKNIYNYMQDNFPDKGNTTNSDLLRFKGASNEDTFNAVLYSLAAILIVIIMFGSISLIYNSFSISVSERTKQFGLLSSIGATKKQMMKSVLFEAVFLSLIGIPLGILAGIGGIGITLKLVGNMINEFIVNDAGVGLNLSVSWIAVAVAVIVGLITVLISAYIPSKRAVKISAIEAIRQTNDINIKAKKVKTSKLTYKLFGFEGMIASKNFKRNRKKYRATVVSLFLSVVLFISASSYSAYINKSAENLIDNSEYDIIYSLTPDEKGRCQTEDLYKELSGVRGVKESSYAYFSFEDSKVQKSEISKDYLDYYNRVYGKDDLAELGLGIILYFINDDVYEDYLENNSLEKDTYMSSSEPKAVAIDSVKLLNNDEGRYYTFNVLGENTPDISIRRIKQIDGYAYVNNETDNDGNIKYIYENDSGEKIQLTEEEAYENVTLQIGTVSDKKPFCVDKNDTGLVLMYPYSAMNKVLGTEGSSVETYLFFKADDHKTAYEKMNKIIEDKGLTTSRLLDYAGMAEATRSMVLVVNIFSYGFIILISLISAANVFNTISTNISLRRREFAMLKSIGMTKKGFNKMMNYECLLYGLKGLIYGIPVSVGLTYLIYRSIKSGWETSFFIPWQSITIAVGSVFAVVFATMLYSMSKIKKDNTIDALRNENL